jgi:proteasome lid subunit RPN8/RPN11
MSDAKFGSWSVTESPIAIEYSLVLIEEIRHGVSEGLQRLSRGGIEVGGVLYGVRNGRTVRVLATREIACEHARGPSFQLSQKDRAALAEQLAQDQQDARLEGMICAGWFVSHTRSEIALADSDQDIYAAFFPAPWQMTMVIRPGRGSSMRAGFFVREADGTVKSERSYMEFSFPDRLAGVLDSVPRRERLSPLDRRGFGSSRADGGSAAVAPVPRDFPPDAKPEFAGPRFLPMPPPKRKWGWLLAWLVLVIGLLVFGVRFFMSRGVAEPVGLSVVEREGQLQIEWNHTANSVTAASGGSLEIVDGADTRIVALTPPDLARGKFTYARNTGDIDVRMTVVDAKGTKLQEASRFLGRPPAGAQAGELDALKQRRDQLEGEVNRLRGQNAQQNARIQQLERTLRILQTRLGIDSGK